MPHPLLLGARSVPTSQSFWPVLVAALVLVIGVGYFAFRPSADTTAPEHIQTPTAAPATQATRTIGDEQRDDLALHMARVRVDLQQAIEEVRRVQRLTEAAGQSLDVKQLFVEARRVQTAARASTAALNLLMRSMEEIEVARNSLTKEN